jgi:hypothetical protein
MSLNYSIAMMGNPLKKEEPKKAYAKAQTNGELRRYGFPFLYEKIITY